jgi:hypothetical protein
MLTFGQLRWLFLAALATMLVASNLNESRIFGVSAEWSNNRYRFAAGTAPWALLSAVLVVFLYVLLVYAEPSGPGNRFRAYFAGLSHSGLISFSQCSESRLFLASYLWLSSGKGREFFSGLSSARTPARGDGSIAAVSILLTFATLLFYYAVPLIRRRPSPGVCVLGYQIIADDGTVMTMKKAVLRTLLGFIAVCSAYLAPFIARHRKNGKFWLDTVFSTQAVRLG